MPAGDNPHSISEKKAALRDSPKEPKKAVSQQPRIAPSLKERAAEIVGIKRPQPNGPLSPGVNGHLVYVRRKLETDQSKGGASAGAESVSSVSSKKSVIGGTQEQTLKHQNNAPHTQSAPACASPTAAAAVAFSPLSPASSPAHHSFMKQSPVKIAVQPSIVVAASPPPGNVLSNAAPQNFVAPNVASCNVEATSTTSGDVVATATRNAADIQRSSKQDWKERFIRLQAFLRNNELSGQEEYIRMLRSLSSVGRSQHAIELEKRAVNLLIEEGKELQKMKVLNVLGKLSPADHHASLPTPPTSATHLPFTPRR